MAGAATAEKGTFGEEPTDAQEEQAESDFAESSATWLSPAESRVRKALWVTAVTTALAVLLVGIWIGAANWHRQKGPLQDGALSPEKSTLAADSTKPPRGDAPPNDSGTTSSTTPSTVAPTSAFASWLPGDTAFVIAGNATFWATYAQSAWLFAPLLPYDANAIANEAMASLGILQDAVTWMGLGIGSAGPQHTLLFLRLRDGQSTAPLESLGAQVADGFRGHKAVRLQKNGEDLLIVLVAPQTVVLGNAAYVQAAFATPSAGTTNKPIPMAGLQQGNPACFVGIDLATWRSRDPRFPAWVLSRIPEAAPHWRRLLELSVGFSIAPAVPKPGGAGKLDQADRETPLKLTWTFASDQDADAGLESLQQLTGALGKWLQQAAAELQKNSQSSDAAAPSSELAGFFESLRLLLEHGGAERADNAVTFTIPTDTMPGDTVPADTVSGDTVPGENGPKYLTINGLTAVRSLLEADWQRRGLISWHGGGQALGSGLAEMVEAEGAFPPAAAGGALLPPDTRLGWIATMLPYLGYGEWHAQLNPGYGWRSSHNQPITSRELPVVINPILGPTQAQPGFFDSHWVGVAGVGEGAAELNPNDPRSGFFNYQGQRRREDLERGAANTLAVLSASARLGPWAEGGTATVRPLTRPPYVNGPDGFGSGLPNGMLGLMADGSVRFIDRGVSPEILDRLAAVHGNGSATAAELFPPGADANSYLGTGVPSPPADHSVKTNGPEEAPSEGTAPPESPIFPTEQNLAVRLASLKMDEVPLGMVLHATTQWSSLPIALQPQALCTGEISLRSPITLSVEGASLREILDQIAEQAGLKTQIARSGAVVFVCQSADTPETRVYRPSEYQGCIPLDEELAKLIRGLFSSESVGRGDPGIEVALVPEGLRVTCPPCTHREIDRLLRDLCQAAHSNSRTMEGAEPAKPRDYPVSATFLQPTPLSEVILTLDQSCEIDILVEWENLAGKGITPQTPVTVTANDTPIGDVLTRLGGNIPLGTLDRELEGVVILTTYEESQKPTVRVFQLGPFADREQSLARIREQWIAHCSPSTWQDNGGDGALFPFPAANCLVVRNSPEVCSAVEDFLTKHVEEKAGDPPTN